MIRLEHVSKSFGTFKAVDDVSFSIPSGEVVGFLGPNGAGKTTSMRLIAGYLSPDAGKLFVDEVSVTDDPIRAKGLIGYLPENNPLYKDMLVSEFLQLSADLHHVPAEKRASALDFVVSAVSIADMFHRPIGELSKGYKQRVGLAAALIHDPRVILLDEPTEGLDPNQRAEIRQLIQTLANGRTIMMSTHVMQEASAICNRLIIINHGKLVADGTPASLLENAGRPKIAIEVEGDGVEDALSALPGSRLVVERKDGRRLRGTIEATTAHDLRPDISKLILERGWTVLTLAEESRGLETLFQELTNTGV